jgi:hypothetical protein
MVIFSYVRKGVMTLPRKVYKEQCPCGLCVWFLGHSWVVRIAANSTQAISIGISGFCPGCGVELDVDLELKPNIQKPKSLGDFVIRPWYKRHKKRVTRNRR